MAEDATWFRLDESESCFLVQMSGSYRDIVCSQSDLAITYFSANITHSSTNNLPIPSPRALVSTNNRRSWARASDFLTRNTQPTGSPSISAIQQCSRFGSQSFAKSATIPSTIASNSWVKPNSSKRTLLCNWTTHFISPGWWDRRTYGTLRGIVRISPRRVTLRPQFLHGGPRGRMSLGRCLAHLARHRFGRG